MPIRNPTAPVVSMEVKSRVSRARRAGMTHWGRRRVTVRQMWCAAGSSSRSQMETKQMLLLGLQGGKQSVDTCVCDHDCLCKQSSCQHEFLISQPVYAALSLAPCQGSRTDSRSGSMSSFNTMREQNPYQTCLFTPTPVLTFSLLSGSSPCFWYYFEQTSVLTLSLLFGQA